MRGILEADRVTHSFESELDDLLLVICELLQLPPRRHDTATSHYHAVCEWLSVPNTRVAQYAPKLYPHGSMRHGTTIQPWGAEEYDLDFVCELGVSRQLFASPVHALDLIEMRLREHDTYRKLIERKKRCIRLNYASEFHLDILPACPEVGGSDGSIVIPDRKLVCWLNSNPRGFAEWLDGRGALILKIAAMREAEPVPPQETAGQKSPLKRVVQLLKRWRDVKFEGRRDVAISMVLTTLAGMHYSGESSVSVALTNILDRIYEQVDIRKPRLRVCNPIDEREDLSERWETRTLYSEFVAGIGEFRDRWAALQHVRGIQNISLALNSLFGETVKVAVEKRARLMREAEVARKLRTTSGGLLSSAPLLGRAVRPHTFHAE